MAGLIDGAQQGAMPQEGMGKDMPMQKADTSDEKGKISADAIRAKIQVPQELQQAYQRVVVAGGKFMFDPRTHEMALKSLKETKGDVGQRLGVALAGLMVMLWQQSNKTIPPQVILPAAMDLLGQAAQFIQDSKMEPITPKDVAKATSVMISLLTKQFGGDPSKFDQLTGVKVNPQDLNGGGGEQGGEGPEGPAHEAAPGDTQEDTSEGEPPDAQNGPTQQEWDDEVARRKQGA